MSSPKRQSRPRNELRARARQIRKDEAKLALDPVQAAATLGRRRLSFFCKYFWDTIIAEDLIWNWHMDILCDEVQAVYERVFKFDIDGKPKKREVKLYDLVINIPPGTSKSTIVSVMAPAWGWTRDVTLRHITGSYSGDLATEMAVKSRDIVRSPKYQACFPEVQIKKDEDGKTNYKTIYGGQRYSTSVGGTITGIHAHIITIDDPINTKQAASVADLATANNWMKTTIPTRKVDKAVTPTILIMQRLATNDPSGVMLEDMEKGLKVRHICLPASVADNVSPSSLKAKYVNGLLDPVRMPTHVLDEMKIKLGTSQYAGQFDQRPTPAGGLIWKSTYFIPIPDEHFPKRSLLSRYGTDWDLAYTKNDDNSASAYVSAGIFDNKIWIDDIGWDWLEFPKLIKWMKGKPSPHYIEAKASGKSAKSTLSEQGIVAIEVPVKGGEDKIARAQMATPPAEAGMVCIRASLYDKLLNDSKMGLIYFPKGSHNDLADVVAQALQRLSARGTVIIGNSNTTAEVDDDPLEWD